MNVIDQLLEIHQKPAYSPADLFRLDGLNAKLKETRLDFKRWFRRNRPDMVLLNFVACSHCNRKGEIKCGDCEEGQQECNFCNGTGQFDCFECQGKGCAKCKEGKKPCDCEGGQVKCRECEKGVKVCPECIGERGKSTYQLDHLIGTAKEIYEQVKWREYALLTGDREC